MDIIFTGGACRYIRSSQPLDCINCKLFPCKALDKGSSGSNTPRYSNKVLTGNWFEERAVCPDRPKDDWITDYGTNYITRDVKGFSEDLFTIWKNKQKTQGVGRKLPDDGDSYLDNMTTTYDLSFRIRTKGLCGPRVRFYNLRRNAWEPETDLTVSFGNQTKYGLVDALKRKLADEKLELPIKSIYQIDYVEQPLDKESNAKRFLKLRGDMNTPDLRHLGINLSSPSRSVYEPQYRHSRHSRCEDICTWLER